MITFQMWEPFRQTLIEEHRFYVKHAHAKVLSQFNDIETESEAVAKESLKTRLESFNPDRDCVGSSHELAYEDSVTFYLLLSEMKKNVFLAIIAGMFQLWDKKHREYLIHEFRFLNKGNNLEKAIWKASTHQLVELWSAFGLDLTQFEFYNQLEALQLIVNVFKHGNGQSFDALKKRFSEYLRPSFLLGIELGSSEGLDHSNLNISIEQFEIFSNAIISFWQAIPPEIDSQGEVRLPKLFEDAFSKDYTE